MAQIQRALIKAGYLKEPPDGLWGPVTAEAMREFQQANGFEATGLPEAKALMKLGLGPHPLPPGVGGEDSASAEAASSGPGTPPDPAAPPTDPK